MTGKRSAAPLCVVTVTYNSASVLPGLLDSLSAGLEGVDEYEVIVVDNDSHDRSDALALSHPVRARQIRMGRNAGCAAGINAATATISPNSDVLILNPDVRLLPGAVPRMLERLNDASVGIVVPRNLTERGTTDLTLRREPSIASAWADSVLGGHLAARLGLGEIVKDPSLYEQGGTVEWASGSALLVAARARNCVPHWDESFFLYSEEVDYQRRVRSSGFTIAYLPQAEVVHIGGASNPRLFALLTANRIRYYSRHHGPVSTALFRLGVAAGEVLRASRGPAHLAALRAALAPLRPPFDYGVNCSQ